MVGDVVVWLPHSPMLAFDIVPSYGGAEEDPSSTILLFYLFRRYKKSFL
jgi:hypothetical protein